MMCQVNNVILNFERNNVMKHTIKPIILSLILTPLVNISPVYAEKQPMMEIALNNLARAEKALSNAAWNKGGHRVKALRHVRLAIQETKKGMAVANKAK